MGGNDTYMYIWPMEVETVGHYLELKTNVAV